MPRLQVAGGEALKAKLEEEGRALLPVLTGNLVDSIWIEGRSQPPNAAIRIHSLQHAGLSPKQKLAQMRQLMHGQPLQLPLPCDLVNAADSNIAYPVGIGQKQQKNCKQ